LEGSGLERMSIPFKSNVNEYQNRFQPSLIPLAQHVGVTRDATHWIVTNHLNISDRGKQPQPESMFDLMYNNYSAETDLMEIAA